MNISKENLFILLDEFGENLLFEPEAGHDFSWDVTRKLDDIDYIKNNLDKPFTVYTDENGKQTVETLYDFIKNSVWGIDIRAGYDNNLGISNNVTIRLPKKKEIDVSWVWDKVNKAQDRSSQNISKLGNQLCSKLNLPSTVVRGTSFGVSIQNLFRESKADEEAKQITDFLDKHSISYKNRYSLGHWNIWIVISKEKQNLDRLEKALNTKKENMIRSMIRRKKVSNKKARHYRNNKESFSSRDVLDRVLFSDANENKNESLDSEISEKDLVAIEKNISDLASYYNGIVFSYDQLYFDSHYYDPLGNKMVIGKDSFLAVQDFIKSNPSVVTDFTMSGAINYANYAQSDVWTFDRVIRAGVNIEGDCIVHTNGYVYCDLSKGRSFEFQIGIWRSDDSFDEYGSYTFEIK